MTHSFNKNALLETVALPPVTIAIVEARGGVGKSTIAHVMQLVLRDDDPRVLVLDADRNNSTQQMVSDAKAIDLARKNYEGEILAHLENQAAGIHKHIVLDLAAGQEGQMRTIMGEMAEVVTKASGVFVVIRPVTACGFVLGNIKTFADNIMDGNMRMLLVKNFARVDDPEDFDRWDASKLRASLLARGALETEIQNAGIALADRMVEHRFSFDALAHGRFEESPYTVKARAEFTLADQLSAARWLRLQKATFTAALRALVSK
jgi:hypothetical protein